MDLKKISLVGLSLFTAFSLMSCSSEIVNQTPAVNLKDIKPGTINTVDNTIFVGDAGNGKKGADLNFTINLPTESGFSTKAAGVTQGLASSINKIRIIVTKNNGSTASPLDTANSGILFDSTISPLTTGFTSGTAKTYKISNLSTAGTYFVGVQFFNGNDNITKNVTYINGGPLPIAVSGAFQVTVDNGTNGIITVDQTTVSVNAALRDGVGASVDASVTATNGGAIPAMTVTNP